MLLYKTDRALQSSHEYPTNMVKYTAPQMLGPKATSIQKTLVGFYHHFEDKDCTLTPLFIFLVWSVAGSTKLVNLQRGNLGTPIWADPSADAKSEGSITQLAQREGTPSSPGIHCSTLFHWLVSILAWASAPRPFLKAHCCLYPNPKLNHSFSLSWSLKRGILLFSESPTQPFITNLHSRTQTRDCWSKLSEISLLPLKRTSVHNLPWLRCGFYMKDKGGWGHPWKIIGQPTNIV